MAVGVRTARRKRREAATFSAAVDAPTRVRRLRKFGWTGLGDCWISGDCVFEGPLETRPMLEVADGVYDNTGTVFATHGGVRIGHGTHMGHGVRILSLTRSIGDHALRAGAYIGERIAIGEGVWIGAGAIVLSGVTVGGGTVVDAEAVVKHDCDPDSLYMGVPARLRRRLNA